MNAIDFTLHQYVIALTCEGSLTHLHPLYKAVIPCDPVRERYGIPMS